MDVADAHLRTMSARSITPDGHPIALKQQRAANPESPVEDALIRRVDTVMRKS